MNNQQNQRNMILAVLLTGALLFGWDAAIRHFYPNAQRPKSVATAPIASSSAGASSAAKPTREGGLGTAADQALEVTELKSDLNAPGRIRIEAPGLSGSINPVGAVIDDLSLNRHKATIEKNSEPVRLFSPAGTVAEHYAQIGWIGAAGIALPTAATQWTAPAGAKLTPATPVTLTWTNPTGQDFALLLAIDADYMITATQSVTNKGTAPISLQPYALIRRTNKTASIDSWNIHSGPFGAFDGKVTFDPNYSDVLKAGQVSNAGKADWMGFTDIYWMSVLIPDSSGATSSFRSLGKDLYRADIVYAPVAVAAGQTVSRSTRLFAGAKEALVLDRYEAGGEASATKGAPAIANFSLSIDWGWFRFFEKPIFLLLRALFHATGNFGVAIILLTLLVRGVMFPVAQRQFASMAAMRAIQPKMKALQERHKDDKPKLQEETMALYKREGVNPLAGCLPVFLQIPGFFALYKVLMVSIDMRHQPFVFWIKDLSAPDPKHILNLFGLLPFDPPSILGLGVLGVLLGITMWLQFKLQPAQPDPAQQQVMAIMPWMMMFIMSPFASGLLVYWITSNMLTIAQQKYLYSKHPAMKAQADKDAADLKRASERKGA